VGFFDGVLVMEMITAADGGSAPGLGQVELSPEQARDYHAFLVRQVVRMLCAGLVHGDLSEYNVLVGPDGPVIIDLPQAVDAAGNTHARSMLVRDVNNVSATLGRFAPELLATRYAEEMWELYAAGELQPDTPLTGIFVDDETVADVAGTLVDIEDAREEAIRRQLGREAAMEP
jgi:RIO kinase 1